MAQCRISIEVAWWVRWYLAGVSLCSSLTGLEPHWAKVLITVQRGIKVGR